MGHKPQQPGKVITQSIQITQIVFALILCVDSDLSHGWNDSFWRKIGLGDLVDEGYVRIGTEIQEPGLPVGRGLEAGAARELGLPAGTPVATAIIDAHAGGIGKGSSFTKVVYMR